MTTSQLITLPGLSAFAAGETIRPLGFRRDGRPIFPIAGGAPDGGDGGGDGGSGDGSGSGDGDKGGDSGSGSGDGDQGSGSGDAGDKAGDQGDKGTAGKVEDLPDWAQKLIKETRGEAAENRTKATAAEKKLTEQLDGIAKALGLKGEEKADPAKLQEQLDQTQRQAREAAVELAVYRSASKHKGDPDALLDSRSFQAKVAELDPTAKDFADKVDAAIKDAVENNEKLKAAQAAGSSSVDHGTGGSGGDGSKTPKTLDGALASHYGTGS